jgi:hypothetical protein
MFQETVQWSDVSMMLSIYGHRKLVITQLKYVRQADGGKKKKRQNNRWNVAQYDGILG